MFSSKVIWVSNTFWLSLVHCDLFLCQIPPTWLELLLLFIKEMWVYAKPFRQFWDIVEVEFLFLANGKASYVGGFTILT